MAEWLQHSIVGVTLMAGMVFSVQKRKLTLGAAVGALFIGVLVYLGSSITGLAMLIAFFIMGTAATAWKRDKKRALRGFIGDTEQRKLSQVIANGGVAAMCGAAAFWFPTYNTLFFVMMAASISTATADTLSSEMGTLYGKRFINIATLRTDTRGMDGVISLEGLVIGLLGSGVIASIFFIGYSSNIVLPVLVIIAGTAGNLSDSLLGALLERHKLLTNDAVNFIATAIGAAIGASIYLMIYM